MGPFIKITTNTQLFQIQILVSFSQGMGGKRQRKRMEGNKSRTPFFPESYLNCCLLLDITYANCIST